MSCCNPFMILRGRVLPPPYRIRRGTVMGRGANPTGDPSDQTSDRSPKPCATATQAPLGLRKASTTLFPMDSHSSGGSGRSDTTWQGPAR